MTCTQETRTIARHTPEPWEHAANGLIYGQCDEDDDEAPFVCDVIEDSAMQALGMLSPGEQANARRIVAAVNACRGIPTESLERGAVAELLAACRMVVDRWEHGDLAEAARMCSAAVAKTRADDCSGRQP